MIERICYEIDKTAFNRLDFMQYISQKKIEIFKIGR
jgi:hypothetical protein